MSKKIYVWDLFVRIFHWSLVGLFVTSYLSGEDKQWLHVYSGYAILALVGLRIIWGFVGSRYARFGNFLFSPATTLQYSKSFFSNYAKSYSGHNPLAGLMVVALLLTLLATAMSGLKLYAVEEGKGPFAVEYPIVTPVYADVDKQERSHRSRHSEEAEELWEDIHESAVNLMLFLIVLHVSGVFLSSKLHKESLIKAMITGYKERQN